MTVVSVKSLRFTVPRKRERERKDRGIPCCNAYTADEHGTLKGKPLEGVSEHEDRETADGR
jgi:hypothetical protein